MTRKNKDSTGRHRQAAGGEAQVEEDRQTEISGLGRRAVCAPQADFLLRGDAAQVEERRLGRPPQPSFAGVGERR